MEEPDRPATAARPRPKPHELALAGLHEYQGGGSGLSPTTVSYILSGKRAGNPAVRSRVLQAVQSLGSESSRSPQTLALGTTRIIVVVPHIRDRHFAELEKGVEATAVERGYNLIVCTAGFDHQRTVQYLKMIRSRAIHGISYAAGDLPTDSELNALPGDTPMIFVDEEIHDTTFGSVVMDNYDDGRITAEHFV